MRTKEEILGIVEHFMDRCRNKKGLAVGHQEAPLWVMVEVLCDIRDVLIRIGEKK